MAILTPTPDETTRYVLSDTGRPTKDFYNWLRTLRDAVAGAGGTSLLKANNLSDVASATTSRTNLGLDNYQNYPAKPAFSAVHSAAQTVGAAWIQLAFNTELYDVGGFFASNAWTPPAGKVHLAGGWVSDGTTYFSYNVNGTAIYKNGSLRKQTTSLSFSTTNGFGQISIDDVASGTDVFTFWTISSLSSGTATIRSAADQTYFMGHWIGP